MNLSEKQFSLTRAASKSQGLSLYKQSISQSANYYLSKSKTFDMDERLLEFLAARVAPVLKGPRVLEMGYVSDAYTRRIVARFGKSYIVDFSAKLLEKAKDRFGKKVETFRSLFEDFKPAAGFDTILATNILEHVSDPVKVLRKAKTWLNRNGRIIVIVPNADSLQILHGS